MRRRPAPRRAALTNSFRRLFAGIVIAALLLAAGTAAQAQTGGKVVPLVRDEQVLVTFELRDGFTEAVRTTIQSGLRTTFSYVVDLRLDVPAWVDRTIESVVVANSVEYDNLTRRHNLVRTIDGRVEESHVFEDDAAVRQWLTGFQRLALFRTSSLQPNRDYYVRVSATARPSNGMLPWPWSGTSAQAKFTFIR
jgi:hypothetical protein